MDGSPPRHVRTVTAQSGEPLAECSGGGDDRSPESRGTVGSLGSPPARRPRPGRRLPNRDQPFKFVTVLAWQVIGVQSKISCEPGWTLAYQP
jgi:hypothetical protein